MVPACYPKFKLAGTNVSIGEGGTIMNRSTGELKKMILQKNILLDRLRTERKTGDERIQQLNAELDSLLYQYYKLLKYN